MTVVVTGASGFVGGNLVRALLAQGRSVRATIFEDAERERLDGLDVEIVEADVRDLDALRRAFDGADVVYHLAGHISLLMDDWDQVEAVNVKGTRHVVEACLDCGVRRLVHFSSFHALQQHPRDVPLEETRPLVGRDGVPPYDWSKAAGEIEVQKGIERGLDAIIIVPTAMVGPYDFIPSFFGTALLDMGRGTIPALVGGGCDWVDVRDVVDATLRAEECAPTGAKYLLSGEWASVKDIAEMVEAITGVRRPRLVVPMWLAWWVAPLSTALMRLLGRQPRVTRVALNVLNGSREVRYDRAARELDYRPRPLRGTLADTIRWYAENGRLDGVKVRETE